MSKGLVAYFSASGVTANVAEKLAKEIGAELFEIQPEIPYTNADLNWQDSKSRSSIEMKDTNCRPAIRSKVEDMSQFDVIFIGFPVWWYREPSIIDTFMETYDFSGKTVVPFVTSGGSPVGSSGKNIQDLAPKAKVEKGKRFSAGASGKTLSDWAAAWL
ncbi:MAG: flavodoxin [Firmicutes bacterium]|nr:flavodoxin [Bacillota bacterium]NBI63877.1 flavodoxin [Clostridiales bacterium]